MMYSKACKLHLEQVNMTRWQHFRHAIGISMRLFIGSIAVLIHAFAPRWLKSTATDTCVAIAKENGKWKT